MNERIKELALDAGISRLQDDLRLVVVDSNGDAIDPMSGLEKFAELIIQECIKICDETEDEYLTDESEELLGEQNWKYAIGAAGCRSNIIQYFEIKE